MSNFSDRLQEQAQLNERIEKLSAFIDSPGLVGIGHSNQIIYRIQLKAMETYLQCVNELIELNIAPVEELQKQPLAEF